MREFARIQRITDLVAELWTFDPDLSLGGLLQKWIWAEVIEKTGDIFRPEDDTTELQLKEALDKARTLSIPTELTQIQKDLIKRIQELWPHVPDQRFGQFLSNYAFGHFMSHPPKMLLQQSDEIILATLQHFGQ